MVFVLRHLLVQTCWLFRVKIFNQWVKQDLLKDEDYAIGKKSLYCSLEKADYSNWKGCPVVAKRNNIVTLWTLTWCKVATDIPFNTTFSFDIQPGILLVFNSSLWYPYWAVWFLSSSTQWYFKIIILKIIYACLLTSSSRLKYVCITDTNTTINDWSEKIACLTFSLLEVKFPRIKQTRTTNSCKRKITKKNHK